MPDKPAPPADPRITLRDPVVAAVLAFLVPGLGHFYQGRRFKALIFSGCILGLFGWGIGVADGKCVYFRPPTGPNAGNRKEFIGFLGQAGAGLATLPSIIQYRRWASDGNDDRLASPLAAEFEGVLEMRDGDFPGESLVRGRIELTPDGGAFGGAVGSFEGTDENGNAVRVPLSNVNVIERPVAASRRRELAVRVTDDDGLTVGELEGSVARPWYNRMEVPLTRSEESDVNDELGMMFELAWVLTMLAGLLNLLAVYDAYEGPAHGYGGPPTEAAA